MLEKFFSSLRPNKQVILQCEQALLSASLNPRFHRAHQQMTSRFLNAYVRFMFDSVALGQEIKQLKQETTEELYSVLSSIIRSENESFRNPEHAVYQPMQEILANRINESCEEAILEAKRKSHQFSQLSQSVLKDQRNNLLLSKIILMAQRLGQDKLIEELSMLQLSITPADAFASKLLQDADQLKNKDNIDVLCYASLAEGIRSVANSQMNHFFQMRRFEQERNINSFNGISSDEITEQLELDVSLVLKYDTLVALEQKQSVKLHRSDLHLFADGPPNWH
jgi:hypothetical protein